MLTQADVPQISSDLFSGFDALDFNHVRTVLVAISGGSDSTALLMALLAYCEKSHISPKIIAATVDHGLRHGSFDEAKQVGKLCAQLGIEHHILNWVGEKPKSGIQSAARDARYDLLGGLAKTINADCVLTGHTLDDQIETALMQKARSDAVPLGIAQATLFERSIWFVRPFLSQCRDDLRVFLTSNNIAWCDDPSNDNRDFERVRIRQDHGLDAMQMRHFETEIMTAQKQREIVCARAADILSDDAMIMFDSEKNMWRMARHHGDRQAHLWAIGAVLSFVGARSHLPPEAILSKIDALLDQTQNGKMLTVHGCLLKILDGFVEISPEARAQNGGHFGFQRLITLPHFHLANELERHVTGNILTQNVLKPARR